MVHFWRANLGQFSRALKIVMYRLVYLMVLWIEKMRMSAVVVMRTIIGRPLTPLKSLKDDAGRPWRDDNSRNKVQNVRGDSAVWINWLRPRRTGRDQVLAIHTWEIAQSPP